MRQAALRRTQARQKLRNGKGLGQIVVRPRVQRLDLVRILISGADHEDRRFRPEPDLPDHLDAVAVRQPEIQQDHIRILRRRKLHGFLRRRGGDHGVVLGRKGGRDQMADGRVVFHDHNFPFIHAPKPPPAEG